MSVSMTFQWKPERPPDIWKYQYHIFAASNLGAEKGFKSSKPATKGVVRALRMTLIQILL